MYDTFCNISMHLIELLQMFKRREESVDNGNDLDRNRLNAQKRFLIKVLIKDECVSTHSLKRIQSAILPPYFSSIIAHTYTS